MRKRKQNGILALVWFLGLLCCSRLASAQTIQILDTLYNADGTKASGRIVISWNPFTAGDGTTVNGGTLTYTIPATGASAGVVNVPLYPNAGASPAGTSYTARYFLANGAQYTETWVVPDSGPATIAAVRVLNAPAPGAAIPISALTGGPLPVVLGGTGLDAPGGANLCLKVNSAGTALEYGSCAAGGTGITSLNGEVGSAQTFATGMAGSDFGLSSTGNVHTFNLPDASGTARGLVTTGPQTIVGTKTFSSPIVGSISGNSATATALAANGANCVAGNYPLGVDASGAAENCTPVGGGGHSLKDEGSPLTSRSGPNFVGPAISTSDDAGNNETDVTVSINDSTVPDDITLTSITQITNRAIGNTTGDLAASRVDDGGAAATQALFSGGAGTAGFRAIASGDVPNLENLNGTLDISSGGTGAAPGSDDQALVSDSSSAATWRSIPDCNTESMLTYNAVTNTFGCEADDGGGGGMTSFNIDGDNNSPQTITNGNEALLAGGAGIGTTAAATDTITIATASQEAAFLADGGVASLTCGASAAGKMQVMDDGTLEWCDGQATAALRTSALGDGTGNALAGDSATALFSTGTIEDARLSANVSLLGQTIETGEITDGTVHPADLDDGTDTPADEDCLTYESTGPTFEWQTCGAGGGGENVTVGGAAATDANLIDSSEIDFSLNTGPNPDEISAALIAGSVAYTRLQNSSGVLGIRAAVKTADETVNNSAALQNDDHLSFAVGANEIWIVRMALNLTIRAASDFQWQFTLPAGATATALRASGDFTPNVGTLDQSQDAAAPIGVLSNGLQTVAYGGAVIVKKAGTSGTVQMQWAQNSAAAEDTTLLTGSSLIAFRVN